MRDRYSAIFWVFPRRRWNWIFPSQVSNGRSREWHSSFFWRFEKTIRKGEFQWINSTLESAYNLETLNLESVHILLESEPHLQILKLVFVVRQILKHIHSSMINKWTKFSNSSKWRNVLLQSGSFWHGRQNFYTNHSLHNKLFQFIILFNIVSVQCLNKVEHKKLKVSDLTRKMQTIKKPNFVVFSNYFSSLQIFFLIK